MMDQESRHFTFSLFKSLLRIAAGLSLCNYELMIAGVFFIIAEAFGIAEEL